MLEKSGGAFFVSIKKKKVTMSKKKGVGKRNF